MIAYANNLPSLAVIKGPFALDSWNRLLLAMLLIGIATAIVILRKADITKLSLALIGGGSLCLGLAAGGLAWQRPTAHQIAVMVDLSPSTRTAAYRNADALRQRIGQLLGETPHRIFYFGRENHDNVGHDTHLSDLPADRTVFTTPSAAAVVLFSDVQFELPDTAPPVYIAVDPLLEDPPDAAIRQLEIRGKTLSAAVVNQGGESRELAFIPAQPGSAQLVEPGSRVYVAPLPTEGMAAARLTGSDPWPENDALAVRIPPPLLSQRWWVGVAAPPSTDWLQLDPSRLPDGPAEYLAPAVIVLANVAADELTGLQQQRLQQYVRDLGGAIVILGGNRAFAAGAYPGSVLESLSPLSSSPPAPSVHWVILGDSSGSMAAREGNSSRWDQVTCAMLRLLPHLPPEDPVTIGSFAADLRWWSVGQAARQTIAMPLPPADVKPNGPTNLEDALLRIISATDAALPKELLLLTDADAEITKLAELKQGLLDRKIRLNLLALREDGRALRQLEALVQATGGQAVREMTPDRWTEAARQLYEQAAPDRLHMQPTAIRYEADLAKLINRSIPVWNRTWLKHSATELAASADAAEAVPLVARWKVGAGEVLAAAFPATPAEAEAFADLIAQPPRDPRFSITWETGPKLRVTVDAVDEDRYLNGLSLQLDLSPAPPAASPSQQLPIPQTGPGRYQLSIPAPRQPMIATVRQANRVLDRTAVAGRYAPEFDAIGNNREAMRDWARRTGGAVIPPAQATPIDFRWPPETVPLTSWLSAAGATLIAAGLLHWRLR